MTSVNPYAKFRDECKTVLKDALHTLYPKITTPSFMLEVPPTREFGELASSVSFELAKQVVKKPILLANQIAAAIDASKSPLIQSVEAAGKGYVNFYLNFAEFSSLTLESIRMLDLEYGFVKTENPEKIIVEHTSVNPIHPIHIGQARNPVLGDAVARILKAHGHTVFRHYYIDDVGRQSAVIAYGYKKLEEPRPEGKPDHFIGQVYAVTSCIMEIHRLKRGIESAKKRSLNEEILKFQRELDDWVSVAADLEERFPKLFNHLLDEINEDPESKVDDLIRRYESGEEGAKSLIREVCQLCLKGFEGTLGRVGITFDSWDWESDFIWSGEVLRILDKLKSTSYVFQVGGVLEFDADKVAQSFEIKDMLGLKEDYEIPSLTLVRADGTTLYTTRDIPYTIWKFQQADKVINVIGMEQTLSQLQLKLALYALGYVKYARSLIHFAYSLVNFPGYRMSARKGRYITFDEVTEEAIKRAYEEVSKRSPQLPDEEKRRISNIVGIGALRYALVEVDPAKPVVFTWDRVLDFERNSAPYIQYSHARACSILRKAARTPERPDYSLLDHHLEHDIILMLSRFPEIFVDAAENLKPNIIADFANALADKFNTFYNAVPVIKAKPLGLSDARLALVDAVRTVLGNALSLLGIEAPQRM